MKRDLRNESAGGNRRGISFEIPNEYGRHLLELLKPFPIEQFDWYAGGEESYITDGSQPIEPLFSGEKVGLDGASLKRMLENSFQYLIFLNMKAFPKGKHVFDVATYEDFLTSHCQLAILVIDSVYVTVYGKEMEQVEELYQIGVRNGYSNVRFLTDENDSRTVLSVW
ncbi:DUF2691 family protein [Paenibacillus sp. FSL W8-1187]|uniref:DUF2691 family protein n=1 Tax=Paenibacillus sp. FSL W8-1187 TaxID=2975339 RepID=UPI0030D85729